MLYSTHLSVAHCPSTVRISRYVALTIAFCFSLLCELCLVYHDLCLEWVSGGICSDLVQDFSPSSAIFVEDL